MAVVAVAAALFGCGQGSRAPMSAAETPEYHVANGDKLLEMGRPGAAKEEYDMAVEMAPEYSPAYVGLALVAAATQDHELAGRRLETAGNHATTDEQRIRVHVGYIRMYTMGKEHFGDRWLVRAEKSYDDAVRIDPDAPAPHFHMARAYRAGYDFSMATDLYAKVIDLGGEYVGRADVEYEEVQKIQRATPGSPVGRRVALMDEITRGDAAALFIHELRVEDLFADRTGKDFDTTFKSPETGFETGEYVKKPRVTDVESHVLRSEIRRVLDLDIVGLRPYPDHTFKPYQPVRRAEFAMMLEDVLIKTTGNEGLATRFFGQTSPFPDVRSDVAYFNAAMVCTTRGFMEVRDRSTGEFDPLGKVSGADALLAIRELRTDVKGR